MTEYKIKTSKRKVGFKYKVRDRNIIKDLERGIYQFCVDHGRALPNKSIKSSFIFSDKDDLLRRIYARATEIYKVTDEKEISEKMEKIDKEYWEMLAVRNKLSEREKKINNLPKFKKYVILKLRQIANKLANKWI